MKDREVFRMMPGFFSKLYKRWELSLAEMEKAMGGSV